MLAIGYTTAPRRNASYLNATLESHYENWDIKPHVFAEPGTEQVGISRYTLWHQNQVRLGIVHNWLNMAEQMLADEPLASHLMLCQDDIRWIENASQLIRRTLRCQKLLDIDLAEVGFISPYTSKVHVSGRDHGKGWLPLRRFVNSWCGNLCMIFPRRTLAKVVHLREKVVEYAKSMSTPEELLHVDYGVGKVVREDLQLPIIIHSPSLILHTGEVSCSDRNNMPGFRESRTND